MIYRLISVLFLLFGCNIAAAQTPINQNDNFLYFRCEEISQYYPAETITNYYTMVMRLVGTYNNETNGVKMLEPQRNLCFLSLGKENTVLAGLSSIKFYTSYEHFICSVSGSCGGNLAGYQAGVTMTQKGMQYVVNTREHSDAVAFCQKSGDSSFGYCN